MGTRGGRDGIETADVGRDGQRRRVSVVCARIGAKPSDLLKAAGGDNRAARQLQRDWEAWRGEYGDAWLAGVVGTPAPPHADLFRYAV
jgi:hypothetical protein